MSDVAFTPRQLDALDIGKRHVDNCIVAGPGSGKTTVLVEYFARLVAAGVDPLRILAITFTEKAAANMKRKLAEKFEHDPQLRAQFERAWVFTIHGFCARLLREQAVWAGVDPEFAIADEHDALRMQQESLDAAMEELFAEDAEGVRALIRGLSSPDFEEHIRGAYDAMRSSGRSIDYSAAMPAPDGIAAGDIEATLEALRAAPRISWSYQQKEALEDAIESARRIAAAEHAREALAQRQAFTLNLNRLRKNTEAYALAKQLRDQIEAYEYTLITHLYAPQRALLIDILRRFDAIYRRRKREAALLDFSDLEEFTVRLLEIHPEVRERLRNQFEQVLMDEFQDTNPQQAKLVSLIRPPGRFYAVGDINQAIYGFRHADQRGFEEYRALVATGGHLVDLTDNFRSRAQILSAVETITQGCPGIEPRSLVAKRTFDEDPGCSVELIGIAAEPMDVAGPMEARWVARRIVELAPAECDFRDIAVLVRNTEALTDLAPALDEAGIPYVINRGRGFYETREVTDLVHLLRVIVNPRDDISLAAVMRSPLVGVSDEALLRLRVMAEKASLGAVLWRVSDDTAADFGGDYPRVTRFRDLLRSWRARREYVSFDRLLLEAIDDCGYRTENGARGAANIEKFLAQAREASGKMSLDAFVEELEQIRRVNPREPDAPPDDSANAVQVMTVHAAKGLEFPVVFVAAMHKAMEKDPGVVAFAPAIGLGARWRNPASGKDKSDLPLHRIREQRKKRESDEGDRLLYVAMTRAEKRLILSYSGKRAAEWVKTLATNLQLNPDQCRQETEQQVAPDGKTWNLRVTIADRAPELTLAAGVAGALDSEPPQLLDPPPLEDQQDANVTVTALAKFAKCPREYYLSHYLGLEGRRRAVTEESEDEDDLPADELGVQVHALLAGAPVENPAREALRLAEVFRQSALGKRAASAKRVEREFAFLMALEGMVVRGQVDLWFEDAGELVIVDYKTDNVSAVEAHHRAGDYELQLKLYAQAVERIAGRPATQAWLHFLRPNVAIEVDLTPSLLDAPELVARDLGAAQNSMRFPMQIAAHCRRCQFYKELCPAVG